MNALEAGQCIIPTYAKQQGRPLVRYTLLKRVVPKRLVPPPKVVKSAPVEKVQVLRPAPVKEKMASMLPHCLAFVDVPNLCRFRVDTQASVALPPFHPISFYRADWAYMRRVITEITGIPQERQDCFLYAKLPLLGREKFRQHCQKLERDGLNVVTRDKKDVDCWLIADIGYEALRFLQKDRELSVVLISGDGDYARALKRLRALGD